MSRSSIPLLLEKRWGVGEAAWGNDSGQQGGQKMDLKKRGTAGFEEEEGKQEQVKNKGGK